MDLHILGEYESSALVILIEGQIIPTLASVWIERLGGRQLFIWACGLFELIATILLFVFHLPHLFYILFSSVP